MVLSSLVRIPNLCSVYQPADEQILQISILYLGFLGLTEDLSVDCCLQTASPDKFLQPPSCLLFFRGLPG